MSELLVTVEQAKAWLAHPNPDARPIDPATLARYAAAMDAGQWDAEPTRDPIVIIGGRLLEDGRHRLSAVVEHGQPVWMRVEPDWAWALNPTPQQ
jgi:hypothetical protein